MTVWPSEIEITRDNFNETPPDRVIRSNMDVGPPKVRRRSSAAIRPLSLSLFLTDDQLNILDAFYLENDSLEFDFVHPRTGVTETARFTGAPTYKLNQTMYDVSVQLEILP